MFFDLKSLEETLKKIPMTFVWTLILVLEYLLRNQSPFQEVFQLRLIQGNELLHQNKLEDAFQVYHYLHKYLH